MARTNGRRLWRCPVYTVLVLVLTSVALLITWKQLPDQNNYGAKFQATKDQSIPSAAGSTYFNIRKPVEKVSVQQVTLVHAERSYTENSSTASNNSGSVSQNISESSPVPSISVGPTKSPVASPSTLSFLGRLGFPTATKSSPSVTPLTEEEIAERKALAESSRKALLGLNDCPRCNSTDEDRLSDPVFFAKFGALEAGRQLCLREIRDRVIEDFRPLFFNVNRIILMDVALHTNMGDNVLWRAAVHLVSLYGHSVNHVCVSSQGADSLYWSMPQFPRCDIKNIVDLAKDNGLVLYHAGGNWGDLYRFVQTYRMKALNVFSYTVQKEGYNFKVVQLPQTIYYTKKDPLLVNKDDAIINSLPPDFFTFFARQKDSFDFAEEHYGPNINKVLTADMAFVLGDLTPIGDPVVDVLVLIRTDGEITAEDKMEKEAVKKFLKLAKVTFSFQDWHHRPNYTEFSNSNPTVLSEVRSNEAIKIVSKGQIVITNRMHGSVLATLIGRTLLWVDTKQKKLAGVRQTAFSTSPYCTDENLRSFEFPTILDAAKAAVEYLAARPSIESFT